MARTLYYFCIYSLLLFSSCVIYFQYGDEKAPQARPENHERDATVHYDHSPAQENSIAEGQSSEQRENRPILPTPPKPWLRSFGGKGYDYGDSVSHDAQGNIILCGMFFGEMSKGSGVLTSSGSFDGFVTKFDAKGNHRWSRSFGGITHDECYAAKSDKQGNIYIVGYFEHQLNQQQTIRSKGQEDIFVQKLSPQGNVLWTRSFGGKGTDIAFGLAIDHLNHIYITGKFSQTVQFDHLSLQSKYGEDIFAIKLDPKGQVLWATSLPGSGLSEQAFSCAVNEKGELFLTGSFQGELTVASSRVQSKGASDAFLVKLAQDGSPLWVTTLGEKEDDRAVQVKLDHAGSIYITGSYFRHTIFQGKVVELPNQTDILLAKYNKQGQILWAKTYGGKGNMDAGKGIAIDKENNVYLTGSFQGKVDFGKVSLSSQGRFDVFFSKIRPNGEVLWARSFGKQGDNSSFSADFSQDGFLLLTGYFSGTVTIGSQTLSSKGGFDIFLLKMANDGKLP